MTAVSVADLGPLHNPRIAVTWADLGCLIVPWHHEGGGRRRRKVPSISGWTNGGALVGAQECRDWWQNAAGTHYPGIVTGPESGTWVLDLDGETGVRHLQALVARHGPLPPEALRVRTPSGGWHLYFAWHEGVRNSQSRVAPKVDVRGRGGYAAAPGTVLDSDRAYVAPERIDWPPPPAPAWLLELVLAAPGREWEGEYTRDVSDAAALAGARPGEQDQALFAYLAAEHRRGTAPQAARDAAWEVVRTWELGDPDDPWTFEDVQEKVTSVWSRAEYTGVSALPPEVQAFLARQAAAAEEAEVPGVADGDVEEDTAAVLPDGFRASDSGNALRLVALADGRIRYVALWQKWLVYGQGRWWLDPGDARVREVAKGVTRRLLALATSDTPMDRAEREHVFKFALRSESAAAIGSMVNLARGVPGVLVEHEDLDADPWLLNCLNGTVDLRTGELRPHDPDDLLTLQCPVVYDPAVRSELWEACVARWQPDPEVRAFLQRAVGSGATGHPVEALIVNVGNGSNGKSKFFGAIAAALGPFAVVPHKSLFTVTRHEAHPTHRASLFRARILLLPETGQGERLNEDSVKALTGGDVLEARRMREDEWKFLPTHTAFMHTNHRPRIVGDDEGIWRRVKLVPWDVTIPREERDEHLAQRLKEQLVGVLSWVVEGAVAWYREGLNEPAAVEAASAGYRDESDTVSQFFEDTGATFDRLLWVTGQELTQRHAAWFAGTGQVGRVEYHYQQLTARLKATEGVTAGNLKSRGGRFWTGLGWVEEGE